MIQQMSIMLLAVVISSCNTNQKATNENVASNEVTIYSSTPHNTEGVFTPVEKFSHEFDESYTNGNFYALEGNQAHWGLEEENLKVNYGILEVKSKYDKQIRDGKQYYFSTGMVISKETTVYGYYEAKIMGSDLWPGVCPAFWLTTGGSKLPELEQKENVITYSEIDIIELQQVAKDKHIMACNLHTSALQKGEDGKLKNVRYSAGKAPYIGRNEFLVDWEHEDAYHIYGCENRPDSIIMYIDHKRVAAKPNYYWHLPMVLKLSVGMRTPFEAYTDKGRIAVPTTAEEAADAGFPTTMFVDYIRTYTRDYSQFKSSEKLFDKEEALTPVAKLW